MHDRNYGSVSYDDDMVTLLPQFPKTFNGFQSFPEPFVPVVRSGRHYLITQHEMGQFCDAISRGLEPRSTKVGTFLLRVGDHDLL